MRPIQGSRLLYFLFVLVLWAAIYLPFLGTWEFKGEEGRRALPAITMLESGDWIVPYVGGEPYFSKPPFINWAVAVSFLTTGQRGEASARLPSALFMLAFASLLMLLRGDWISPESRLIAAIVFLTSVGSMEKGRLIEIEGVYLCLTGMAILWWLDFWARPTADWLRWILPSVLLGCGLLTKGPLILVVFYCTVISVAIRERRVKELFSPAHLVGILIMIGIFSGWFYLATQRVPVHQIVGEASGQISNRLHLSAFGFRNWAINLLQVPVLFLPWILFLPFLWSKRYLSGMRDEERQRFKGCRTALVISFVLINLMPGTHPRYSLPIMGLSSILFGWVLAFEQPFEAVHRSWRLLVLGGSSIAFVTALIGLAAIKFSIATLVITILTSSFLILLVRAWDRLRTQLRLSLVTGVLAATIITQYAAFGGEINSKYASRRPTAAAINNQLPHNAVLYAFKPGYQAFLFYVRPPLKYLTEAKEIDDPVKFLLVGEAEYRRLMSDSSLPERSPKTLVDFTYRRKGRFFLLQLGSSGPMKIPAAVPAR